MLLYFFPALSHALKFWPSSPYSEKLFSIAHWGSWILKVFLANCLHEWTRPPKHLPEGMYCDRGWAVVMAVFFYIDGNLKKCLTRWWASTATQSLSFSYVYVQLRLMLCSWLSASQVMAWLRNQTTTQDTGSAVAFLAISAGGEPDPGTPLACGLEKIQLSVQTEILYFISSLCSWKGFKLKCQTPLSWYWFPFCLG